MQRKITTFLALLIIILLSGMPGMAGQFVPANSTILVDGTSINCQKPIMRDSEKVYVSLPDIVKALGGTFYFDPIQNTAVVIYKGQTAVLETGKNYFKLNNNQKVISNPTQMINGDFYVPIEVLNSFSAVKANFDLLNNTLAINTIPDQKLRDIRYNISSQKVRMVFDFQKPLADYQVYRYYAPDRIVIEIPLATTVQGVNNELAVEDNLVKKITFAQNDNKSVLITIFLASEAPFQQFVLKDPDRLVVDVAKVFELKTTEQLSSGLEYQMIKRGTPEGPITINTLKVDLNSKDIDVKPVIAGGKLGIREKVSDIVKENRAVAGINGGYFGTDGAQLGFVYLGNEIVSSPLFNRTAFGLTSDKKAFIDNVSIAEQRIENSKGEGVFFQGINRLRKENEIVVYTPTNGQSTGTNSFGVEVIIADNVVQQVIEGGNSVIPRNGFIVSAHGTSRDLIRNLFTIGDMVNLKINMTPDWGTLGVVNALGGGPRLVKNGQISLTSAQEQFKPDIAKGRAPRSALGVTSDNKLILVAIDGRQEKSIGVTLDELANIMLGLGAVDAMNLDGGGSTAMIVDNKLVNSPSDGSERKVGSAIVINYKQSDNQNDLSKLN